MQQQLQSSTCVTITGTITHCQCNINEILELLIFAFVLSYNIFHEMEGFFLTRCV